MTITLLPVRGIDDLDDAVLRSRAVKAPGLATIRLLRAMADGVEAALVVLDVHPDSDSVILYEIFLSASLRNRGIGTKILAAVESHAMGLGRTLLEVWPRSVDRASRSDAQLRRWYRSHGYVSAQAGSERLKKVLRPT